MSQTIPLYIDQRFTDFETYKSESIRWNIDFKKMNKGEFKAGITIMDFGLVQLGQTFNVGTLIQNGQTPLGYKTFALPADKEQNFDWFNRSVQHNHLLVFPDNHQIDALSKGFFNVYTIAIEKNYLQRLIMLDKYRGLEKSLTSSEVQFSLDNNYVVYLRSYIETLFLQAKRNPGIIHKKRFKHSVLNRLMQLFMDYIDSSQPIEYFKRLKKSEEILNHSINYMNLKYNEKYSITQLCRDLNISERTLEYAFHQKFGIGPKRYSMNLKLHRCRKAFLSQQNSNKKISEVAARFGFDHMGQFSVNYKELFGEMPSETLRKN